MDWPQALLWANPENVERLARRFGVPIPALRDEHARHVVLCREVNKAIEKDRMMAEAEERRAAERAEQKRIAREIADALGETGPRPRRQIARILGLMGEAWVRETLAIADRMYAAGDASIFLSNGARRTRGGAFFYFARARAADMKKTDKRQYYRCFHDRPPKPRKKSAPKPVPVRRVETPVRQAQGKPKRQQTVPEVVVQRRRA